MATGIFIAVSPGFGGDGGYWYIGADGKLHRVPPWSPEVFRDLNAAASLLSMAEGIKQVGIRKQLIGLSEELVVGHIKEIQIKAKLTG
jgi:hypothetical protein